MIEADIDWIDAIVMSPWISDTRHRAREDIPETSLLILIAYGLQVREFDLRHGLVKCVHHQAEARVLNPRDSLYLIVDVFERLKSRLRVVTVVK